MSKISDRLMSESESTSLRTRKIHPKKKTLYPAQNIIGNSHGDHLKIPIDNISPDPEQPRKNFDKESLQELSDSIKACGILQPILVRELNGVFWIVAGERRFRAAKMAELEEISAIITTGDPSEISLIENLQRENLSPLELANALDKMMKKHNYTQTQLGKIIGKSQNTVSATLSLLKLPEIVKEDIIRMRIINDEAKKISRRVLIDIAQTADNEEDAITLYNAAKSGATSEDIREKKRRAKAAFDKGQHVDPHVDDNPLPQAQSINKRSQLEILIGKIEVLIKAFEGIDDPKRFKGKLRSLLDELETQFIRFK